ncbi:sucrase ferredoxin [Sphaerospermopsis aphanizomenoides BCCUSP55]|uniref:sucrase ferredoxin n=1 Tax=Sphaerospermopsis aphanizomenoides TaxID=459663 RepID=UPI001908E070|nr:sucrase ferredoxin [Sphaerospermopsis aphanizomenoides]MBK1989648.1 sucrase ferredoxin [Sphaerospermopsis aphanizomenoides BCCUSP55]
MNTFFCSDYSRQIGEDIIGSATNYQTYVLVECPQPWMSEAFQSKWVADNLRLLVEEVQRSKLPIRFLLIANDESHKVEQTTLLIYQKQAGLSHGYYKQEFKLPNIEQVAGVVRKWLSGGSPDYQIETSITRDILVCTHGSHDQCCARYGNPFYFYAKNTISDLQLNHVRIWKSSHFGGHRFAPTAIDLPEARYYGVLDQDSFKSILTRTGDIQFLNKVYRGWGLLPSALQILEREIIFRQGWDWFNYKVAGKILEQSLDNNTMLAELTFEQPSGSLYTYQAKLVKDAVKTQVLKSSCHATQESLVVKYAVANLWLVERKVASTAGRS